MTAVTITTQLSTFTIIRDILRGNSSIGAKFAKTDFYEFEEKLKAIKTRIPLFVIMIPSTETDLLVFDSSSTIKEFSVGILLKMDYSARDNFITYANAVIYEIEKSSTTFEASGYYFPKIELIKADAEVEDEKQLIVGEFELKLTGNVVR